MGDIRLRVYQFRQIDILLVGPSIDGSCRKIFPLTVLAAIFSTAADNDYYEKQNPHYSKNNSDYSSHT